MTFANSFLAGSVKTEALVSLKNPVRCRYCHLEKAMRARLTYIGIATLLIATSALAEDGVWRAKSFVQLNSFCVHIYRCGPADDVLPSSDTEIVSTRPKVATGVCSAGNGPVNSCNVCLTTPPRDKCAWHLERKIAPFWTLIQTHH
jgi:hypothetical protein